jgi:hypothetical protein
MNLQHRVQISIAQRDDSKKPVLKSGLRNIPRRLLNFMFGDFTEVLVLKPGQSVQSVEIHELKSGGASGDNG